MLAACNCRSHQSRLWLIQNIRCTQCHSFFLSLSFSVQFINGLSCSMVSVDFGELPRSSGSEKTDSGLESWQAARDFLFNPSTATMTDASKALKIRKSLFWRCLVKLNLIFCARITFFFVNNNLLNLIFCRLRVFFLTHIEKTTLFLPVPCTQPLYYSSAQRSDQKSSLEQVLPDLICKLNYKFPELRRSERNSNVSTPSGKHTESNKLHETLSVSPFGIKNIIKIIFPSSHGWNKWSRSIQNRFLDKYQIKNIETLFKDGLHIWSE